MTSTAGSLTCTQLTERQRREAEYYDEYSRINAPQSVDFTPVLSDQRRPWSPYWYVCGCVCDAFSDPSQRLLDFGCGYGVASVAFARVGYRVEGFDISKGNVDAAGRLAESHGLASRCRFATMPAERLAFPDGHFDVVVGLDVLHHVDVGAALDEARRVLKPAGVAIFKEPVRVPVVDRVRETLPGRVVAPRRKSFDRHVHITDDERKLTCEEVRQIRDRFDRVDVTRFSLLLRLHRLLPRRWFSLIWKLYRADYELMRWCPPIRQLGDVAVFVCRKA